MRASWKTSLVVERNGSYDQTRLTDRLKNVNMLPCHATNAKTVPAQNIRSTSQ